MISLRTNAAVDGTIALLADNKLKALLNERTRQLAEWLNEGIDLSDLTHFLIMQPGDTAADAENELGWSLLHSHLDNIRFDQPGYITPWEYSEHHDGWWELLFIISDDGFGITAFLQDIQTPTRTCWPCAASTYRPDLNNQNQSQRPAGAFLMHYTKDQPMNKPTIIAAATLTIFGIGYVAAPRELLDEEVQHSGFLQVDTTKVLSATVASLREENKLLVYSYKGAATVNASREVLWLFEGRQKLIVPAAVSYTMDLSKLNLSDVTFDSEHKLVNVKLPRLEIGDIAFQPEEATTVNGGLLTYSEEQTEDLQRLNYATARRAMITQAQQPGFVSVAKRRAIENVEAYFTVPLRLAGLEDVRVVATFD